MIGWVKYLVYIMSFFIPPVGVITFWIFSGRDEESRDVAKWSFLAAFIGLVVCAIIILTFGATHRAFWPGMDRW
ncbi:MAG: hypothetical protein A2144_06565 [Chloroflexi bacterium RBG_16_50_9]|nr:MAG: hypothetical protein A2144_06565 [Chloroflexi bacterium RBG_16_50_9]